MSFIDIAPWWYKIYPKKKAHAVYMLMDPRNAETFYIGLSKNPQRRFGRHVNKAVQGRHGNVQLGLRIRDIIQKKSYPAMIILYAGLTEDEAASIEKMVIKRYKKGHKLLNLTEGGELGGNSQQKKRSAWSWW